MRIARLVLSLFAALVLFGGVAAAAAATTRLHVVGNLDAGAEAGTVVVAEGTVVDATGATHELTFEFVKQPGANAWDLSVSTSSPDVVTPNPLAAATVAFDANGRAQTLPSQPEVILVLAYSNGAPPQTVRVDLDALHGRAAPSTPRVVP